MDIRLSQADISDHSWDFPDLVKKESFDSTLIDERCAQRVDRSFLCFRDVNLQVAANRSVGRTFAFSGFFQRVVINHDRNDGSARFRIAGTPMAYRLRSVSLLVFRALGVTCTGIGFRI